MKILFDINHPAHVHLFKNFILYLKKHGHFVFVVARNKDIANVLLSHYGIEYTSISSPKKSIFGMLWELIKKDYMIYKLNKKYHFDVAFGSSPSIAHLSVLSKVKSYNFTEDDDDIVPLYKWITYPFTTKVVNPSCIKYSGFKKKRVFHNSYQKLAYLHPEVFTPDLEVLNKYNLKAFRYVIVRLSALEAHHDTGAKGISQSMIGALTNILEGYEIVFSREKDKRHTIDPWDMHHVMAFAKLVITDSLSMSVEASVLGAPVVRYNSFEGKSSVLNELQYKYQLACGYNSKVDGSDVDMADKVKELLQNENLNNEWQAKRKLMLNEKEDMNKWMIDFFENELNEDKR